MPDYSDALATALAAVAEARTILLAECARPDGPRGEIGQCPADLEAETAIRDRLLAAFPTYGYLGEESGAKPPGSPDAPIWIVDPNDGTTSMQRGYRGHAIAVGLVHEEMPVLGVVCAVDAPDDTGDLFAWADGCGPPKRNNVPMQSPRWTDQLGPHDIIALSQGANRNPLGYSQCVLPARFVGLPSIAYRLALVAAGECTATLSLNLLSVWDYAAGHALVRGAGGVVTDADGVEIRYPWDDRASTRRIFAGSRPVVHHLTKRPWRNAPGSGFGDAAPPADLAPIRAHPTALVHDNDLLGRVQGCLLGLLAADAFAGPTPYSGQPTANAELALLLARRLVADRQFDAECVSGTYASCDQPQTPHPLARAASLGIWGAFRDARVVAEAARKDAQLTHTDPVWQDAAALLAAAIAATIRDKLTARQTCTFALDYARAQNLDPRIGNAITTSQYTALGSLHQALFHLLNTTSLNQPLTSDHAAITGALLGAVHGRSAIPFHWQQMVLTCRPMSGWPGVSQPRSAAYWPTDALVLAERLVSSHS